MSNINVVAISGFLAGDPETRWTSDDGEKSIVRLGVVVKRSKREEDGSYTETSAIFDVEVFGKFATLTARKLRKLDSVTIQGKLEKDEWETESGEKRSKVKVIATTIDSEGYFRSKDEDNDTATTADAPAASSEPKAAPGEDDIPF